MPEVNDDDLLDLRLLIRVGRTALTKHQFAPTTSLQRRILRLLEPLREMPIDGAGRYLDVLVLDAEYEYSFGREHVGNAAQRLFESTERLREELRAWRVDESKAFRNEPFRLMRRKVWALMSVAFYCDYANGRTIEAIATLRTVERLVELTLIPLGGRAYNAHGTRSRLHEYLGQALRTQRHPDAAEAFHDAQRHAEALLLAAKSGERTRVEQLAVVTTTRVLGGLGRLALLQGNLTHALQLLRAAHTLLIPSGNVALKGVVESHIAVANRRRLPFGTRQWDEALAELERLWREFGKEPADYDGMRRCSYELAQASLEAAELASGRERANRVSAAELWISHFESVGETQAGLQNSSVLATALSYRSSVLKAFACLLNVPPRAEEADEHLRAAQGARTAFSCHFDLAGCDSLDVRLAQGVSRSVLSDTAHAGRQGPGPYFHNLRKVADEEEDLELAAEATIRAALAEFQARLRDEAIATLEIWKRRYEPVVENTFIKALGERSLAMFEKCPPFTPPMKGFSKDIRAFKLALIEWAVSKHGNLKTAARELNTTADVLKSTLANKVRKRRTLTTRRARHVSKRS